MSKRDKIQYLLIKHLLNEGQIKLNLPNGLILEVGITQEDEFGDMKKTDDYCWATVSQDDRLVSIDTYNLGLKFSDNNKNIIVEHDSIDENGDKFKLFEVA